MKDSLTVRGKIGELLRKNRFAAFLEIAVVFLPLYLGLIISDGMGSDHVSLGGSVVLLGGPIAYLGLIISLTLLWVSSRLRGAGWVSFGVIRPESWLRTVLKGLGVALVFFGIVALVINPILNAIPNLVPRDMSVFDHLTDNLPNLLINMVFMWLTAGFLEELLWRGYVMNRLMDLLGKQTKLNWMIVILLSAVIFGLGHGYQGTMGMLKTGAIGGLFGVTYLVVGRNLWPLIFAHALIDSIDFVIHFLGG
jgi:hypothetical protein